MQPNWIEAVLDYFGTALLDTAPALPEWFNLLGLMAWPLALCGLLIVAIALERIVFFLMRALRNGTEYQVLLAKVAGYKRYPKHIRDDFASILLVQYHLQYVSGLKLLRTIAAISPMLGLLGTILGIISAFKVIAVQTGPVSPNLIADGLWEAMLTTAVGLVVALPAMMFAYIFKGAVLDN